MKGSEIIKLTKEQQYIFDLFDTCLQSNVCKLLPSDDRRSGKTTILNYIGITYQALGYQVILMTQFPNSNEHIATDFLEFPYLERGKRFSKQVIAIIDEYNYDSELFHQLKDFLNSKYIPYVGFVRYSKKGE